MKRLKFDSPSRLRPLHLLIGLVIVYSLLMTTQLPVLLRFLDRHHPSTRLLSENPQKPIKQNPKFLSNLVFRERKSENNTIYQTAMQAWLLGKDLWVKSITRAPAPSNETASSCSDTVLLSQDPELERGAVDLPCGLTLGSHITVVGRIRRAHLESDPRISLMKTVMVSQFILELRRMRVVHGEEPAKLLHFNPRIKGDWSDKPVIEMNNCYRGQWGAAVRCEGRRSPLTEETVDGQVKCEEWKHDDNNSQEESKAKWLEKLVGWREKAQVYRTYPFSEDKFFVLTVNAALEGYHISVDGRHITSFAYRNGFDLEDAMMLYVYGDVDIHSIFAASLPTSLPNVASERHLEMSAEWKAQPLPNKPIVLFIGVISAGDHFAERMAVRKSWMQHYLIRSSIVVARFFVALHEKEAINVEMRKEAEFFSDIVIVPYLDNYDLVVLKTLAICEYGVNILSTKYIMKCDDDTFVRVDAMVEETRRVDSEKSLYAGKLNYYHTPLRSGKWAVTHKEWPGEFYPPYADGPGYIVSSDIAHFIVSEFEKNRLKLFKMEDVSMGMWVEQFNKSKPVEYRHNSQFYQFGCLDDYYTAHYQSPKQLICLWERLQTEGKAICCNL